MARELTALDEGRMTAPNLEEYKQALAIVEGRSVPGYRTVVETTHTAIVPIQPIAPVVSQVPSVSEQLPELISDLEGDEVAELLATVEEVEGVRPDHFLQIVDELGRPGLEEVIGTALAVYGGYKLGKAALKAMRKRKIKRDTSHAASLRGKADVIRAKADLHKARKETGSDLGSRIKKGVELYKKGKEYLDNKKAEKNKAPEKKVRPQVHSRPGEKRPSLGRTTPTKPATTPKPSAAPAAKASAATKGVPRRGAQARANLKKPDAKPRRVNPNAKAVPLDKVKKLGPKIKQVKAKVAQSAAARRRPKPGAPKPKSAAA